MYMSLRTENLVFYRRNDGKQREFIMKKLRFLGIIAAIAIIGLSTVSCDLKFGGTLIIENKTGAPIIAFAAGLEDIPDLDLANFQISDLKDYGKEIKNGESYEKDFSLDGKVYWYWGGIASGGSLNPNLEKGEVELKGGESKTITAE